MLTRLFITGDIHGEQERFTDPKYGICGRLCEDDCLLIVGDFGFIFNNDKRAEEDAFLDVLEQLNYTIIFCDGNHENFARLTQYPEEMWHGGRVHRIRQNILHLMRGQVFDLLGWRFFVMGGGCSFGLDPCIEGTNWWRQESPCGAEYDEALQNLEKVGYEVDYVITHTAPINTMRVVTPDYVSDPLNYFLEWLQDHVEYKAWYYGHLHLDMPLNHNQTCIYYDVVEIAAKGEATDAGY